MGSRRTVAALGAAAVAFVVSGFAAFVVSAFAEAQSAPIVMPPPWVSPAVEASTPGSPSPAPSVVPAPWVSPLELLPRLVPGLIAPQPPSTPSTETSRFPSVAPRYPSVAQRQTDDSYPLDAIPRETAGSGALRCPDVDLVSYRGDVVGYRGAARVNAAFRERLRRFEVVVRDTAIEVYGRAPTSMRLMGTYSCRRIRRIDGLISEHAFGNAIDVASFDFPRASAGATPSDPRLARAFSVSVLRHWNVRDPQSLDALHSRFLRTLIERILATPALFRVVIGPADPDHRNHFHLDCAPYRFVNV